MEGPQGLAEAVWVVSLEVAAMVAAAKGLGVREAALRAGVREEIRPAPLVGGWVGQRIVGRTTQRWREQTMNTMNNEG